MENWGRERREEGEGGEGKELNLQNFLVVCLRNTLSKLCSYTH